MWAGAGVPSVLLCTPCHQMPATTAASWVRVGRGFTDPVSPCSRLPSSRCKAGVKGGKFTQGRGGCSSAVLNSGSVPALRGSCGRGGRAGTCSPAQPWGEMLGTEASRGWGIPWPVPARAPGLDGAGDGGHLPRARELRRRGSNPAAPRDQVRQKTPCGNACFTTLLDHLDTKSWQQRDMSLLYTGMSTANKLLCNTSYNFKS